MNATVTAAETVTIRALRDAAAGSISHHLRRRHGRTGVQRLIDVRAQR